MDYSNSYGVHPLWPVSSRWFYGDSVFIVEPWFWVAAVPPLVFAVQRRLTRIGLALVLLGGLVLAWVMESVPWGVALALSVGSVAAAYVAAQRSARGRVVQAITGCAAVLLALVVSSRMADARLRTAATADLAQLSVHDIILTPQPANPLCFAAIVIGTRGDTYVMRTAQLSSVPGLLPGERCRLQPSEPTAPLQPLPAAWSRGRNVQWLAEFRAPLTELRRLNERNCELAAFLRFARAPYWLPVEQGRRIVGDLRYDRAPELDFADVALSDQPTRCPPHVPRWQPPRSDVLTP
jgi:inner membrane protein